MDTKPERRKTRIELAAIILSLVLSTIAILLSTRTLAPLHQPQIPPSLSEEEFRSKQLEISYLTAQIESQKTTINVLATVIPIMLAILTLAGTIWAARKTVIAQFTTKAAELALLGEGPDEVLNRAKLLAHLYKDLLPEDFIDRVKGLNPDRVGRIVTQAPWGSELMKEVIALVAEKPQQRDQILADYISVLPSYDFLKVLQRNTKKLDATNAQEVTQTV